MVRFSIAILSDCQGLWSIVEGVLLFLVPFVVTFLYYCCVQVYYASVFYVCRVDLSI